VSEAILAIRPRALGDVVLVSPALRALRRGAPDAALEVVTERRYAALVAAWPGVTKVWPLDPGAGATVQLGRELRRRRYRAVVDFFGNPRSAQLAALAPAPLRAGYDLRGRAAAYHVRVPRTQVTEAGRREYSAATHVRLAVAAGGVEDGVDPRITVSDAARAAASQLMARAGFAPHERPVGVVAAGTWPTKTWPASHFAVLCRGLLASGRRVLLLSGPGEEHLVRLLERLAPGVRVLPPCGVAELAAVIARLAALVGTDSGPRHLAAALGVPTFAWFGPTHPDNWNPPGAEHGYWFTDVPCRGCDRTACPHWVCMPSLTPAHARGLVLDHLDRHAGAALGPASRA
jgi:ADP-heptose:LPS heptosyltransferase